MIQGKNIYFRAIEESDFEFIVKARNLEDVNKYFYEHEPLSIRMQKNWYENYLKNTSHDKLFVICDNDHNPIGTVGIYHIDWRSRKAEWGRLFLVGDIRGKGYGSELEKLVYDYVFNHLNLNKLYCEVFTDNEKVVNMHLKFGNIIEGTFKQHVYRFGEYKDVVRMCILRDTYYEFLKKGIYEL